MFVAPIMATLKRTPPNTVPTINDTTKPPDLSSSISNTPVIWDLNKKSWKRLRMDDPNVVCDDDQIRNMSLEIKELHKLVSVCTSNVRMLLNENAVLKNNFLELKATILDSMTKSVVAPLAPNSFSSALKPMPNVKDASSAVHPSAPACAPLFSSVLKAAKAKKTLVINPVAEQDPSELRKVLNKIKPTDYCVESVRKTAKGGVVIECGSSAEREKLLKKTTKELGANFSVLVPEKKLPRVRVYGMSCEHSGDDLLKILKDQNSALFSDKCVLKVVHSFYVASKSTYGAYIEVDSVSFAKLIDAKKVFINWDSCWVNEDLNIRRCFKCWGFNHVVSTCNSSSFKCPKCSGDHHQKDCTSSNLNCPTCCDAVATRHLSIDTNHSALCVTCPSYLARADAERRKINYNL